MLKEFFTMIPLPESQNFLGKTLKFLISFLFTKICFTFLGGEGPDQKYESSFLSFILNETFPKNIIFFMLQLTENHKIHNEAFLQNSNHRTINIINVFATPTIIYTYRI